MQETHHNVVRDPSHARALTTDHMQQLMRETGLTLVPPAPRAVEVHLDRWLDFTVTAPETRQLICETLIQDLQGLKAGGLRPYMREQALHFRHAWPIAVGVKERDVQSGLLDLPQRSPQAFYR